MTDARLSDWDGEFVVTWREVAISGRVAPAEELTMDDSFLSLASWLFFASWGVMIGAVSVAAFGRDLIPLRAQLDAPEKNPPSDTIRTTPSNAR